MEIVKSALGVSLCRTLACRLNTIKGQIFIVFLATVLSVCTLIGLNHWSLATVKDRLLLGERYDDMLNNILEVRRYEKNFLLYQDAASLQESGQYLQRIDQLVRELEPDMIEVFGPEIFKRFSDVLVTYSATLEALTRDPQAMRSPDAMPGDIRVQGKALLDLAGELIAAKRERIHETISRTQMLPFAFLALFLLSMAVVIVLVAHGLLKPLDVIRSTTARVARGDFSPITLEGRSLGEIAGLIEAFNRMARELEDNQESLLQARKIAALGTFTAGIAHELNNPINNISLTAETLLEDHGAELPEDASELARDIVTQAERAGDIVRNLLDFSRTEQPSFNRLAPARVASSTVNLIKNQVMISGVRLITDVPESLPPVRGDMRNLQQVFMNLLLNAVQATPPGGLITLTASADPSGFVRFAVRDTGSGIRPEVLEHIFEPFYTTKEVGRGTGLGLSVTYAIVKRHGGRIEVASVVGKGTTFTVFLPQDVG